MVMLTSPDAEPAADPRAELHRLRAELEAVKQRSELAFDFIENGSIGLHGVGPDGTILWANQTELTLLGYSREEYIGKSIVKFHAERSVIDEILTRLSRNETLCDYEAKLRCKNGDIKTVLINSSVLWKDGEFIQTRCFTRDITDYKLQHLALMESEERYRTLIAQANDAIFVADAESGTILDANRSAEQLLGISLDRIKGMHQSALHPPEMIEEYKTMFREHARKGGGELVRNVYVRHSSGRQVPVEISANVIKLGGKPALQGIFRDVTERKLAEAEITAKAAELARSNAELSQFASIASHDLQEPLRMISSYISLLERRLRGTLDDKSKEYMAYIGDGAARLRSMIKSILSYASVGTKLNIDDVPSIAILREALDNLEEKITSTQAVISFDELPRIRADRMLLVVLFQNLISNAIKFCRGRTPAIRITARSEDKETIFTISDNGIGIRPEDRSRLFALFTRLHMQDEFPGTGIGLATCLKIVERHGGRIWVESTPDVGSMFSFSLPR